MKLNRLRLALAAAAVGALAVLSMTPAAGSAHRVPTAVAARGGPALAAGSRYLVCLYSADGLCWLTQGVGNQTQLGASSSTFTVYTVNGNYEFQNANGHCEYVNGNKQLITGQNACQGDSDQQFTEHTDNGGAILESVRYPGTDILVFNAQVGKPVWVEAAVYGVWDRWVLRPA